MQTLANPSVVFQLVAVMVGAGLGYLSGRLLEARKQLNLQRAQAYAEFLKALAIAATNRRAEALELAADAKTRICIYGSPRVIRALSMFERAGAQVIDEAGRVAVIRLIRAMKADVGVAGSQIEDDDLFLVLFGPVRG